MAAEVLLRHLARKYVEDQLARYGVDHLVEIEARPNGLLVRVVALGTSTPASTAAPATSRAPRKVVSTTITDGALADAERTIGKSVRFGSRHRLVVEVPTHYDETEITANRIAADPEISVISRVEPTSTVVPEPESAPALAPITVPAPITVESTPPPAPTKIVHTDIADEQGRFYVVSIPEDYEEEELTAESIKEDPAISIVARVRPQADAEAEQPKAAAPIAVPPPIAVEATPTVAKKVITTHGVTDDQGRTFVIEVPEDFEHEVITREIVETHPGVSIVSRVKLPPPEPEPDLAAVVPDDGTANTITFVPDDAGSMAANRISDDIEVTIAGGQEVIAKQDDEILVDPVAVEPGAKPEVKP